MEEGGEAEGEEGEGEEKVVRQRSDLVRRGGFGFSDY